MNTNRVINVASVPHRSPFRYPGGKTWLVPYIRMWLKSRSSVPHQLVEPFAGGAIVGLSALFENLCDRLTLIELDTDVAAVWQAIVGGEAEKVRTKIANFEVTRENVLQVLSHKSTRLVDRAFATIVKNRMQRGGILAPGASLMKQGENGKGLHSRWYPETLRTRIRAIDERRNSICFIHGDGISYLEQHCREPDTVYFIDPPYTVAGGRLYAHSIIEHERLFQVAQQLQGDFLMSYDNVDPVRKWASDSGFDIEPVAMKNTHHAVMSEILIGRDLTWLRARRSCQLLQNSLFESR